MINNKKNTNLVLKLLCISAVINILIFIMSVVYRLFMQGQNHGLSYANFVIGIACLLIYRNLKEKNEI